MRRPFAVSSLIAVAIALVVLVAGPGVPRMSRAQTTAPATCITGGPDSDRDGLCDSWEIAGGIDLNGDGKIKDDDDLPLPLANPNRPDIYLQYDYMVLRGPNGHSHEPAREAIQMVVDAFAARGIALHIHPAHHPLEHRRVITYDTVVPACAGTDAVNFYDVKARNFDPRRRLAYHYAIFGHYNTCDPNPSDVCPGQANCCANCGGSVNVGSGGLAELPGNDVIVSLGSIIDFGLTPSLLNEAGMFMHELGHNLGLDHAGDASTPDFKPNFFSVMNLNFTFPGICTAASPGLTVPVRCRVDYSGAKLADLNEANLDENVGVSADSNDITTYNCPDTTPVPGPGTGPIDWNCNSNPAEPDVPADVNADGVQGTLTGYNDWANLFLPFQVTSGFADGPPPLRNLSLNEPSILEAFRKHRLFPHRNVGIAIRPGCSAASKPIAPGQAGPVTVAILGAEDLDVTQIELSSLKLHGAAPVGLSLSDVNGDGRLDLTAVFDMRQVRLHPNAQEARLTGWLKNSQAFSGTGQIIVVPNLAWQPASCRN